MLFQKLAVTDCPLYLRLLAGPDTNVLSFVLKENETGDVEVRLGPFAGVQTQPSGTVGGYRWALPSLPHICGAIWQQENDLRKLSWVSAGPGFCV